MNRPLRRRPFLGAAAFACAVVLLFVATGELVSSVSAERDQRALAPATGGEATPEAGEAVFWGRGKCFTCHAVGARGSAIRGPNQGGSGPLGLPIGVRAVARARERAQATGRPYTPTEYLVESLLDPGAYVVEGYKNEMPNPLRPPISLGLRDVRAVVIYLQSLGGTPDPAAVHLPPAAEGPAVATEATDRWTPYLVGDARRGHALFFAEDSSAGCGTCHQVGAAGGRVGPELTHIAGTRELPFIVESILDPSRVIASGYEPVLLVTKRAQYLTGIIRREDASIIELVDSQGRSRLVPKREVARRVPQTTSLMPENFAEILTVQEFRDLLAYVLTLQ